MKLLEPTLVIMAAGMGSRYGGLKQIDPMSDEGEIIIDFSLYDACRAGFRKAVFIIKDDMERDLRALIDGRAGRYLSAKYAAQRLDDLPGGLTAPEGRVKPWGTSHAVWSARGFIDGPCAVINADDYYGADAFRIIYEFLANADADSSHHAMVGYILDNTLTGSGAVARGVCEVSGDGFLTSVTERKKIMRRGGGVYFMDGDIWRPARPDSVTSMNFWGFMPGVLRDIEAGFPAFMESATASLPVEEEYLLPVMVDSLLRSGRADVRVLRSEDRWHGVTYQDDKPVVRAAMRALKRQGVYPERLWE
ncbi:MAG: nucleotidyltransferase [Oscillospiraceae bacterium]|nr:nucleotidyltransferase [Oscillospiraceae bacterium]